ncbi:ATP-binding protein, partial [Treponema pallidum]
DPLMRRPPCRTPHSSASAEGIIGGAGTCLPGEISLAHGGVLFLDEATQFKRPVLETLRTPLETGQITVSRAGKSSTYPARFQLLLAVNPCACGNFGVQHKVCTCAPQAVERYWRKLTAPLLDRVDLRVEVLPPASHTLLSEPACCTARLRKTVACALEAQWERQGSCLCAPINGRSSTVEDWIRYRNARLSPENVQRWCMLTDDAAREFHRAVGKEQLSGRGGHAVLKIARTIADIEGVARLQVAHVQEAVALRTWSALLPHSLT